MIDGDDRSQLRRGFFGRRKGHRLRPRHAGLLETLLPQLALDLTAPAPPDLARLFPGRVEDVWLEIGFGGGEYLTARAVENPGIGFIGCEPFVNGMAKALSVIDERKLDNVRLHPADAVELLDWLPSGALAGIDLIYPDPWPKRRHWKRRFIQQQTIADLARVLRPGGEFRFVTDMPDYAAWTLARLMRAPEFIWNAECANDWRQPWPGFVGTRYQAKTAREGRPPCYLIFRRRGPTAHLRS